MLTGDQCSRYEARWFTLAARDKWSSTYLSPVGTHDDNPTIVWLHNPSSATILIYYEDDNATPSAPFDLHQIPAGQTIAVQVPIGTGARFSSLSNTPGINLHPFYALATIDSNPTSGPFGPSIGSNSAHDWGFALLPRSQLTSQINMVGFAPGFDPTYDAVNNPNGYSDAELNSSPVWVTADHFNAFNENNIQICVDYNGDGGTLLDAHGNQYDQQFVVRPLEQLKLRDSDFIPGDFDNTAMRIWVCDGSGALLAGAYG